MNYYRDTFLKTFESIDFERIIDHPNILIAANFWDKDRYCAAKTCYKFMRAIDDLIDDHKSKNRMIAEVEQEEFESVVNSWLKMVVASDDCNPLQKELSDTVNRFMIPLWPLEAFARSMYYDIYNEGFATFNTFLSYAEGASVGPASIFVHLNGLTLNNGVYQKPAFDVKEAATPCAIFSYLVHIIRDFRKDQLNNLHYFADDMIANNGLTRNDLGEIAKGKEIPAEFRNLIREYYYLAGIYKEKTYEIIGKISPLLEPRYQLSLIIIFELYLMVYERIDVENGSFATEELNPTPSETRGRVYDTIMKFRPV